MELKIFQKKFKEIIGNKKIITSIYGIRAYNTITCGYFCIRFIDFMLKNQSLLDYSSLFSCTDYEKHDKIILKYFQWLEMKKLYCVICGKYRTFGNLKNENEKIFKDK